MAILEIQPERFNTRKSRLNWLLDRLDVLVERFIIEKNEAKQNKLFQKIITLTEYIETTRITMEREGLGGDPVIQGELSLTDTLLWSDDR